MSDDRTRRLFDIFDQVEPLAPADRAARLDTLCAGDADARETIERWLADERSLGLHIDAAMVLGTMLASEDEDLPGKIGRYTIRALLGSGGMGVVYEAEEAETGQVVALKVLRRLGLETPARVRFRREARILARLEHPNIARILASGVHRTPEGQRVPYFAMELIRGARSITEHARDLDERACARSLADVCDAVGLGHAAGVFHRDLKPSNILVGDDGVPKVIDFGVASSTDADLARTTLMTGTSEVVGTLAYMSPEQLEGGSKVIGARTDVYALGLVLYEMLCRRPAYEASASGLAAAVDRVRADAPARPRVVRSAISPDAEAIVLRAIEKDPARRYSSAEAMRDDLRRLVQGRPVSAVRATRAYLARRFVRRHRVGASIACGAGALALGVVAALALLAVWALRERDRAGAEAYYANIRGAESSWRAGEFAAARRSLDACDTPRRGWEWRHLDAQLDQSLALVARTPFAATDLAFSRDGSRVLVAINRGEVRVLDTATGRAVGSRVLGSQAITSAAIALDEQFGVVSSEDGGVYVLGMPGLTDARPMLAGARPWRAVAVHPDGERVACIGEDGELVVWSLRRHVEQRLDVGVGWDVAWSPDGRSLAAAANDAGVLVWNDLDPALGILAHVPRVVPIGGSRARSLAFSPEGGRLAIGDDAGGVHVWSTPDEVLVSARPHSGVVRCVRFSADGSLVWSGGEDRLLRGSSARDLSPLATRAGHEYDIHDIEIHPATGEVWTAGAEGAIRRWSASVDDPSPSRAIDQGARFLAVASRADAVATLVGDRRVRVLDASGRERGPAFDGCDATAVGLAIDAAAERVAVADDARHVRLFDLSTRELSWTATLDAHASAIPLFSPDASRLLLGLKGGGVVELDAATGRVARRASVDEPEIASVAYSPDGSRLAAIGTSATVHVFELSRDAPRGFGLPHATLRSVAFTPDGSSVLVTAGGERVTILDLRAGRVASLLREHENIVEHASFAPDASRFATAAADGTARVWDAGAMRAVLSLRATGHVQVALWTHDSTKVVTLTRAGEVRVWDAVPARAFTRRAEVP